MVDRRWGGVLPDAATQVEWQAGRERLDAHGLDGASQALAERPALAAKLTADGPRPFLRLTVPVPDRENRHQDRAETLPLWGRVCQAAREWAGPDGEPLRRIRRLRIDGAKLYQTVRGCLTSYAKDRGDVCEGIADGHRVLDALNEVHQGGDADGQTSWEKKAKASGVWEDLMRFSAAENPERRRAA